MSTKTIDCKGLACPQPVILTKKELEKSDISQVEVTVDNITARENLLKLGRSMNIPVQAKEEGEFFVLTFEKGEGALSIDSEKSAEQIVQDAGSAEVVLITSEFLGRGDDALGKILMKGFIYTLSESTPAFKAVLFLNSGVKLTAQNEETIVNLKKMSEQGVKILSCGTCLDFYHLKDQLQVGEVANMYDIVEMMRSTGNKFVV